MSASVLVLVQAVVGLVFFTQAESLATLVFGDDSRTEEIEALWLLAAAVGVQQLAYSMLDGYLKHIQVALFHTVTIGVAPVLALVILGGPTPQVIRLQAMLVATSAVVALALVRSSDPSWGKGRLFLDRRSTLKFALSRWLGQFPYAFLWVLAQTVVAISAGPSDAASFAIGATVVTIATLPVRPMSIVLLGRVSAVKHAAGSEATDQIFQNLLMPTIQASLLTMSLAIPVAPFALSLWLGAEGADATQVTQISLLAGVGLALYLTYSSALQSSSERALASRAVWAGMATFAASSGVLWLAGWVSAVSIAIAAAASITVLGFATVAFAIRLHGVSLKGKGAALCTSVATATAGMVMGFAAQIIADEWSDFYAAPTVVLFWLVPVAAAVRAGAAAELVEVVRP